LSALFAYALQQCFADKLSTRPSTEPTEVKLNSIPKWARFALLSAAFCAAARAGTITLTGSITQSTADGTGPASNNTSLNDISDGQAYSLSLLFAGDITAPGTYHPASMSFTVPGAPASESAFGTITLVISNNAGNDIFSILGCLTTGTACDQGNQLTADFQIPAASLNLKNVSATGLNQPHPLDLLEDDGTTDIQGTITGYSYTGAVPEPSFALPLSALGLALVARKAKS
jgi:hypothetical protein